jgi:hypothetical protein
MSAGTAGQRFTAPYSGAHRTSGSQTQPLPGFYQYLSVLKAETGCAYVADHNANAIDYSTFPETPAAGVTTWSGAFATYQAPGGQTGAGTFVASFSFLDPDFFLATEAATVGSCVQKWQGSYVRMGAGP